MAGHPTRGRSLSGPRRSTVFLACRSIKCGMSFASGFLDGTGRGYQKMAVQAIFVVIVPFCYQGLLAITYPALGRSAQEEELRRARP